MTLTMDGTNQSLSLPIRPGTIGPSVADISKLYATLGIFTYDIGYGTTAACDSKITYIDGPTRACCCTAATRSNSSRSRAASWKSPTCF